MPGASGGGTAVIKPHIWNPYTGGIHVVEVDWQSGSGDEFLGGAVLPDGRVVFCPAVSRSLLVWEPGLDAAFGRDVALSGFWNHRP